GRPVPSHVPTHAQTAAKVWGSEPVVRLGPGENGLAGGGNGIRTVSPSPVRVGLFAACGKFAAWLDLFMTPWWRKAYSNCQSHSRTRRSVRRNGDAAVNPPVIDDRN